MSPVPATRPRPVPLLRTWGIRPNEGIALPIANGVYIVLVSQEPTA